MIKSLAFCISFDKVLSFHQRNASLTGGTHQFTFSLNKLVSQFAYLKLYIKYTLRDQNYYNRSETSSNFNKVAKVPIFL